MICADPVGQVDCTGSAELGVRGLVDELYLENKLTRCHVTCEYETQH